MEKLHITQAVLVEGRYDKQRLRDIVDTEIFTSEGFGIFRNEEKKLLLKAVAEKKGLIILTDSDNAGFLIRNKCREFLPKAHIIHLYAPQIVGKERRKKEPSKQGLVGIEGTERDILKALFEKAGVVTDIAPISPRFAYTKADLFACGLCGKSDASSKRIAFCASHDLPHSMTPSALLEAVNILGISLEDA